MKRPLRVCPRCGGRIRPHAWTCARCRSKRARSRPTDVALLWAGALR